MRFRKRLSAAVAIPLVESATAPAPYPTPTAPELHPFLRTPYGRVLSTPATSNRVASCEKHLLTRLLSSRSLTLAIYQYLRSHSANSGPSYLRLA